MDSRWTHSGLVLLLLASAAGRAQTPDPAPEKEPEKAGTAESAPATPPSPDAVKPEEPLIDPRDKVFYPGDTERLKPLAKKLFSNIVLDQKDIWTSPFRMTKRNAPWWIGIAGVTSALILTDNRTITTFENSRGQISWGNRLSRIGATYTLIPLVAGYYVYGMARDEAKPREIAVLSTEAMLDALIFLQILKPIGGRARPDEPQKAGDFFQRGASFPSGHSMIGWSLASVLAHEYHNTKAVPIVVYSLASLVSLSRFAAQKHFASDIFFGAAVGWAIGRYVFKTHMDHAIHKHPWSGAKLVPQVDPRTRSYGVALVLTR